MIPTLETDNLILRPLRLSDLDDLFEYAQDPEVYEFGMWRPYESREACADDLARLVEKYENGTLWWWAIVNKGDGKMIGRCELTDVVPHIGRADIGYALNKKYWGKGYATQAIRSVMRYGFADMKLNRIAATVLTENAASVHLLEKMGMTREGTLRQDTKIRGYLEDVHLYGILKVEWENSE